MPPLSVKDKALACRAIIHEGGNLQIQRAVSSSQTQDPLWKHQKDCIIFRRDGWHPYIVFQLSF